MTTSFMAAVEAERSNGHRPPRRKRTPLLVSAGRLVGRHMPRSDVLRRVVLTVGGMAAIDYGVFQFDGRLGWLAVGISGFVLEWLTGADE